MIKESVWPLGKTVPWNSGEIREAFQINSENLLDHIEISQTLQAIARVVVLMTSNKTVYQKPEDGHFSAG